MPTKLDAVLKQFQDALERFEEVLKEEKTAIVRDSAIKRFEIVFDLSWKALKAYLEEYHNTRCVSPKNCFREAFSKRLIEYDDLWIKMADDRNATAHIYNEAMADDVYEQLSNYINLFQKLKGVLTS